MRFHDIAMNEPQLPPIRVSTHEFEASPVLFRMSSDDARRQFAISMILVVILAAGLGLDSAVGFMEHGPQMFMSSVSQRAPGTVPDAIKSYTTKVGRSPLITMQIARATTGNPDAP